MLGYSSIDDAATFYDQHPLCDIYTCIKPVLEGTGRALTGTPLETSHKNLSLMCGNLDLSEAETQISVALATSTAIPAIRNIPGTIGAHIRQTAEEHKFDYVLVDMSPSVGALNECVLMCSDFFIIPTAPDFFCAQAIKSLTKVLPRWNTEVAPFRNTSFLYPIPESPPKFIGFLSQKYRPRNGAPAKSFQKWIDIIQNEVNSILIPALQPIGMSIELDVFQKCTDGGEPFNLANISDFNSLIAQSQKHNVPVFALTDDQIEQGGRILDNMEVSRDGFEETFTTLAENVHKITEAEDSI